MRVIKDTFLSNKGKRVLFVVFAFLLLYLVSYIIDPFAAYWENYFKRSTLSILEEWILSFIFCLLISESSIYIHTTLNKYLSWTENSGKRMALETGLNLSSVGVIIMIYVFLSYLMNEKSFPQHVTIEELRGMFQWIIVSVMIAFMIITINTGNFLIENWKNSAIEAAEHKLRAAENKQVATEAELQALKLQIDPHFVFNNLSVLSELILEDQQLGYEYAENFSKVYRYLLVNSRKDVIMLAEELKFLNAYIFLIRQRVGNGVHFEINLNTANNNLYLPPLTLQLLVENALKHNKTIKNNPLHIKVYDNDNGELIVVNTLIPIENQVNSSGIGIQNIIRRYSLLSERLPQIIKDTESFKVIIPLIKYDQ